MKQRFSQREMLRSMALVGVAASGLTTSRARPVDPMAAPLKGRLKQSVCRWTYGRMPLDELCRTVKRIGFSAIDLTTPDEWPTLKAHGVYASMCWGAGGIDKSFANPEHHEQLVASYKKHIDLVAEAGYRNLICFSGNRNGTDSERGLANAETGLKRVLAQAEKHSVTIVMELLNSKVDHADYFCDRSAWGVELCLRIGSPNFGLIYDIYHMQIMEGDIIASATSETLFILEKRPRLL